MGYFVTDGFPKDYFPTDYFAGQTSTPVAPPVAPIPYSLADAIMERAQANATTLAIITAFYQTEAGERCQTPYVVFKVRSGRPILTTDVHYVFDQRVTIAAYADTQSQANSIRTGLIIPTFGQGSYTFQTGFSIPFFQEDTSEGKERGRGPSNKLVFKATIDYSARTHRS